MGLFSNKRDVEQAAADHIEHVNGICNDSNCWCHNRKEVERRASQIEDAAKRLNNEQK